MSMHSDDPVTGGDANETDKARWVGGRAAAGTPCPAGKVAGGVVVFGEQRETVDLGMFSGALVDWITDIATGENGTGQPALSGRNAVE
jgi:hypothetical protein